MTTPIHKQEEKRRTRTRMGCQRCRVRRRKCDLEKPHCQRCITAGTECDYLAEPFIHFAGSSSEPATGSDQTMAEIQPLVAACTPNHDTSCLWEHYRDLIAPWMDIGNHHRTFGQLIPSLAQTYPAISNAILKLAAESSRVDASHITISAASLVLWELNTVKQTEGVAYLLPMLSWILQKTQNYVESIPDTWESFFSDGEISLLGGSFDSAEYRTAWLASVGLMSRLEIAWILISQWAPVQTSGPLREAIRAYRPPVSEGDESLGTLATYLHMIAILTDVCEFCFRSDTSSVSGPVGSSKVYRSARWVDVATELQTWYSSRPESFQSTSVDARKSAKELPNIKCLSDVGVAANMLYHMSALQLLSHKPKSSHENLKPSDLSQALDLEGTPLWHAKSLCGIAIANTQGPWDPLMVAAFYIAAQLLVDVPQQTAVIERLEELEGTGWRVGVLVDRLRQRWASSKER